MASLTLKNGRGHLYAKIKSMTFSPLEGGGGGGIDMYDHAFMRSCFIVARLINVEHELTFKAMAHQPTQLNCSVVRGPRQDQTVGN